MHCELSINFQIIKLKPFSWLMITINVDGKCTNDGKQKHRTKHWYRNLLLSGHLEKRQDRNKIGLKDNVVV